MIHWTCRHCHTSYAAASPAPCPKCQGREEFYAALSICQSCEHWTTTKCGGGCDLHPVKPCQQVNDMLAGQPCLDPLPKFGPLTVQPRKRTRVSRTRD